MSTDSSVLVVDDQQDLRGMLAEYLAMCGFTVHEAKDGVEAINVALDVRPRVVLMDLMMPRMDGWEATRRLKADERTKDATVIAVSAYSQQDDRQDASRAGCAEFIPKPVDLERLADAVRRFAR